MPTFTYPSSAVSSSQVLYEALVVRGVTDAVISRNGQLTIRTSIGDEATCDLAVEDAAPGSLDTAKSVKTSDIHEHSTALIDEGVEAWGTGQCVGTTRSEAGTYYNEYLYLSTLGTLDTLLARFTLISITDVIVSTYSAVELKSLVGSCESRLHYVYTDGEGSEEGLIDQVNAAVSVEEVNAVTDNRT